MRIELGVKNCLYPMLTTLVGANVHGKPNYIAIAHVGIMDLISVSLGIHKSHYTNQGIKENSTFSVNLPSLSLMKETDYCGLVSGKDVDKGSLFTNFYGKLGTAPMIVECPINMECRLIRTVDFPHHDIFVGEIVEAYAEEEVLTEGAVDLSKVQPILFSMHDKGYWRLGERTARAWSIGRELKGR